MSRYDYILARAKWYEWLIATQLPRRLNITAARVSQATVKNPGYARVYYDRLLPGAKKPKQLGDVTLVHGSWPDGHLQYVGDQEVRKEIYARARALGAHVWWSETEENKPTRKKKKDPVYPSGPSIWESTVKQNKE